MENRGFVMAEQQGADRVNVPPLHKKYQLFVLSMVLREGATNKNFF